jgi:hypothetical protein
MIHLVALGRYRSKKERMEMIAEKKAEVDEQVSRSLDAYRGMS